MVNGNGIHNSHSGENTSSHIAQDRKPRRVRVRSLKPEFSQWTTVDQNTVVSAGVQERVLVNAGPGTGKTWALIERIIFLVNNLDIDPETIQVLCFSRAAVEEIKDRMKKAIFSGRAGLKTNYVDIRTFDSFVTQFLYWIKDSEYKVLRKDDQIERLNYDERIKLFTKIIKQEPDIISQCEHLIVDEVQDLVLSRADLVLEMIRAIPSGSGVTLLGDCCQAIYGYQVEDGGRSTEDFYRKLYEEKVFKRYSFLQNHRQTETMNESCRKYRASIMSAVEGRCNETLKTICEQIPVFEPNKISKFSQDSLMKLQKSGTVAILTRSNAQALEIAHVFSKKNIDFVLKKKRNENKLNKWIGYLFNETSAKSFDKNDFYSEIGKISSTPVEKEDYDEIWKTINDRRRNSTGRISCQDILIAIRNHATNRRLFVDTKDSKTIISTVHRSKGREYENVLIDADLLRQSKDDLEEHRVSYVALSRARSSVYTVEITNRRFKTLKDRRCFSWTHYPKRNVLERIEIGFDMDIDDYSFCAAQGRQSVIRKLDEKLIGKRVYLRKSKGFSSNKEYDLIIEDSKIVIASTGPAFISDLECAIKQLLNLPRSARVYDNVFPARFVDIYISDVSSSIGMAKGNEFGVAEYGDVVCWNTLLIDGYARAEYDS